MGLRPRSKVALHQSLPNPFAHPGHPHVGQAHIFICHNCLLNFQEPNFSSFAV